MSPEEKAKDLLEKFTKVPNAIFMIVKETMRDNVAKHCALICVHEIVEELELYQDEEDVCFEYWNEVKEELEKL